MPAGTKLLLIGGGKMGGALLQGITAKRLVSSVYVIDPATPPEALKSLNGVTWLSSPDKIDPAFAPDIVIVAVKPQQIASALPAYTRFKSSVFLSIAAGITLAALESRLGSVAIVRAMPNLPASIGRGMSAAVANTKAGAAQRALCDAFLKAVGETVWLEDERLIDAATALSGSGPAYVFALCETMARAGEALGLPATLAATLARQTVIGSGALLEQSPDSAEALRIAVTSPGGTTEAALRHLLAPGGLPELMRKAMTAAERRAKELAQ